MRLSASVLFRSNWCRQSVRSPLRARALFALITWMLLVGSIASGATCYYVGGATNAFSNPLCWASASGGIGGTAAVPGASDTAIFDTPAAAVCAVDSLVATRTIGTFATRGLRDCDQTRDDSQKPDKHKYGKSTLHERLLRKGNSSDARDSRDEIVATITMVRLQKTAAMLRKANRLSSSGSPIRFSALWRTNQRSGRWQKNLAGSRSRCSAR